MLRCALVECAFERSTNLLPSGSPNRVRVPCVPARDEERTAIWPHYLPAVYRDVVVNPPAYAGVEPTERGLPHRTGFEALND